MRYEDKRINDIRIAYIGGGSRGWARTFITDLAMESPINGTTRLCGIDAEVSMADEIIGNWLSQRPEAAGKWTYEACMSLEEALTGADFVVISILPDTFGEMVMDAHMSECLGIYQSVGDTANLGSVIRALRTIPMHVELAKAIRDYAPRAWAINYTNPMPLCIKTLYHVFPQIRAFSCCHEVFGTQKVLKGLLEDTIGLKGVSRKDIRVNVLSIDHFTWFDYTSYEEVNLFPMCRKCVDKRFEEGYTECDTNWTDTCFVYAHRVKFDLFRRYGLIATAGDRHLAEFIPGDEYLEDPETVARWKFNLTSMDWQKEGLGKRVEKSRKLLYGKTEINLKPAEEEGILLIKALCGLERVVSNMNIPNTRLQISNLLADAVVEADAIFEQDVIQPMLAGSMPEPVKTLIIPAVESHEAILEAALTCDEELVVQAFMGDPQVRGRNCRKEDIRKLARDMVEGTIKYLSEAWAIRK